MEQRPADPSLPPATTWRERLDRVASGVKAVFQQPVLRSRAVILVCAVLVLGYAAGVLLHVLALPEIGLRCAFSLKVNHFYDELLFSEKGESIQPDDTVLKVGDHVITSWPLLLRCIAQLDREPTQPGTRSDLTRSPAEQPAGLLEVDGHRVVRVEYHRPGEAGTRQVWCRVGSVMPRTLLPTVLYLTLKLGLFFVGALVYWKRPEDTTAGQFFLFCVVSVIAFVGGYHWWQIVPQPALLVGFMFCAVMLPAVSLHLYMVFPRPRSFYVRNPWTTRAWVYAPAVLFFLILFTNYLRLRWLFNEGGSPEEVGFLLGEVLFQLYIYFVVAALYFAMSIVCLIHSYRRAADLAERKQVEWVLFGYLAAVVPIAYTLYLAYFRSGSFGGDGAVWPMFAASMVMTIAFTISITRYKLMQLDSFLSSGAVYFLLSSLAGLVFYGLVFVGWFALGQAFGDIPSLGQLLAVCGTALLLVVALDLIRSRLKTVLDRHFRKEKYQLDRTLSRMRETLGQLVDPPTLARRLLQSIIELLGVQRGAVYLRQGDPARYVRVAAEGAVPIPIPTELPPTCPLVEALPGRQCLLPVPRGSSDPAIQQLQILGGELALGLVHEGKILGLLLLGPRNGGAYSNDDLAILTAFGRLAALSLVGAEGHRTIEALNRELQTKVEKIAEQQRRILALQAALTRSRTAPLPLVRVSETEPTDSGEKEPSAQSEPREDHPEGLVGSSGPIRQLMHLVRKVAASPSAVLLRGESGTGKEVLARVLHESSPRAKKPFIKVHCAALSAGLLESELFGHVKGAFTSAIRDKIGRFEAADGGTLFLDEIGDISLEVQTKLLRVLQEMTFERVGSSEPIRVDVRIVAATHQNLELLIRQGKFREDLFYRLNVFPIVIPPLRDRPEDIPELVQHFLTIYGQRAGKVITSMDDDALLALKNFSWPGNVRQLENVIERAVVVVEGAIVTLRELPPEILAVAEELQKAQRERSLDSLDSLDGLEPWLETDPTVTLQALRTSRDSELALQEQREREMLVRALAVAGGNKSEAARALGMARTTFLSRLRRLGLG